MDIADVRKRARELVDNRSAATVKEYQGITARLDGQHWHEYATARCLSKRSAAVLRAASRFNKANDVLAHLRAMNQAQKAGDKDAARLARQSAESVTRSLEEPEPAYQPPGAVTGRKSSKRRSLSRLPKDWRERVLAELSPRDLGPAVVLILTGCRPGEYKRGVTFERHGDQLRATIHGGKCSTLTGGGQALRTLDFSAQEVMARTLLDIVDKRGGQFVAQGDLGAWRKRFTRAGERVGFRRLSPYSLRHQFASDQKQRGWNDDRLSQALGQASSRMRRHYGHSTQGRGRGGGLQSVSASVPVRQKSGAVPAVAPAPGPDLDLDLDDVEPGPSPG